MNQKISVLIIEDNEDDEELMLRELGRGGFLVDHTRVATAAGLTHALERKKWDVVLCDYVLPGFGAPEALKLARKKNGDEIPFIIVSGAIDEETAVEIMRSGADDFVFKGNLRRLVPVVKRELEDAKTRVEKKRAEEENLRLRIAIEQSGEAIIITDASANILYVNNAFEKITGFKSSEAIGKNPRLFKSGKHDREFYRRMWEALLQGKTWKGSLINKAKSGELFEEAATISPVFDAEGKISNFVAIKRDVTSEAMLARAKNYFTSVTSHEMNTPLSKLMLVKTLVQEMDKTKEPNLEKTQAILDDAYYSFERISSATSLLSYLALAAEGSLKPLILRPTIAFAAELARERMVKAGRKMSVAISLESLPMEIMVGGEGRMLSQLFQEILSNAVKYTPDGKEVSASAYVEGDFAVVEIRDQGPGIPAEQTKAVFQPFFSLENPLQHSTGEFNFKGGGIGLGLTLSKMIVDFHHGTIAITSNESGATVTIRLPITK